MKRTLLLLAMVSMVSLVGSNVSAKTVKVSGSGSMSAGGLYGCNSAGAACNWAISNNFPPGTSAGQLAEAVRQQLVNPGDPGHVPGGAAFLACGCAAYIIDGQLTITCPGGGTVAIDIPGAPPQQDLRNAAGDGLTFKNAIPVLSPWGFAALGGLLLATMYWIIRRRAQEGAA